MNDNDELWSQEALDAEFQREDRKMQTLLIFIALAIVIVTPLIFMLK